MLNCRETSKLASESMDRSLPLGTRISMRLHLMMCRFCRRYFHQIRFIREALKLTDEEYNADLDSSVITLPPDARERIEESLGRDQ